MLGCVFDLEISLRVDNILKTTIDVAHRNDGLICAVGCN